MTKDRAKSLAEPCLLLGIGCYLLRGITRKSVELSPVLMNSHVSLRQVAELFPLSFHQLIQNVVPLEGITKLRPSHYVTIRLHCNKTFPPFASNTFQKVCRKHHTIIWRNMRRLKLTLDGIEPIIGIKGLR